MSRAISILFGGRSAFGVVYFTSDTNGQMKVKGEITGLPHGKHTLNIHCFGDITNGFISVGPRFNPINKPFDVGQESNTHQDDLGSMVVNEDGFAKFEFNTWNFSLSGIHSIIGRSLVVEDEIRKTSDERYKTENSVMGFAWGVIGICQNNISQED